MEWWIELDRFVCTDRDGYAVDVIKRQRLNEIGTCLAQGAPVYTTATGEPLQRLDRRTFRRTSGDLLTRRDSRPLQRR
jgi:hypothetical protein